MLSAQAAGVAKKREAKNKKTDANCVGFDGVPLTVGTSASPRPRKARPTKRLQHRADGNLGYKDSGAAFGETAAGVVASTLASPPSADTGSAVPADESSPLPVGVLYDLIARTVRPAMMSAI